MISDEIFFQIKQLVSDQMDPGEIGLAKQSIFEQNALEDQP